MMTDWHDSATKLFKENPQLGAEVLRDLMGVPLKGNVKPVPLPQVLSDKPPNDLIPDLAFRIGSARNASRCFIVELQTKMTKEKQRQWPRYVTALWLTYECPVDLLVICPDETAAHSCAQLIYTNLEHFACPPKVLAPWRVPFLATAEEVANQPALAVLSVAYHGEDPKVRDAFVAGTAFLGEEGGNNYYDWGYAMSAPAVQQMMEELMNSTYRMPHSPTLRKEHEAGLEEGREEGREEGLEEGREEGRAEEAVKRERKTIYRLAKARGLTLSELQRARVDGCPDLSLLELWSEQAETAESADDVFR